MSPATWTVDPGWPQTAGSCARYAGASGPDSPAGLRFAPKNCTVLRGRVDVRVSFEQGLPTSQARIVFGRDPSTGAYMCAGLGGYNACYVVDEWIPHPGLLRPLCVRGEMPHSASPWELELSVTFHGRRLSVMVDSAVELETVLPRTVGRTSLGLFAWGGEAITFSDLRIEEERPQAFVAMQFQGYNQIYDHVIERPLDRAGINVDRIDKRAEPNNILEDIRSTIKDADLVVAEITPANENVFYEVGYAYARDAPTILLVREGRPLPFDIRTERCIMYEDTPQGRQAAARALTKSVKAMGLV